MQRVIYLLGELKDRVSNADFRHKHESAIKNIVEQANAHLQSGLNKSPLSFRVDEWPAIDPPIEIYLNGEWCKVLSFDDGMSTFKEVTIQSCPFSDSKEVAVIGWIEKKFVNVVYVTSSNRSRRQAILTVVEDWGSKEKFHESLARWERHIEEHWQVDSETDSRITDSRITDSRITDSRITDSTNDARDKWLREQKEAGELTMEQIATKLKVDHRKWEPLNHGSINSAIKRYESRKHLRALPNRRRSK